MNKRRITEYSGIILICICCLFAYLRVRWLSAVLWLAWYLIFGFVGLAYITSTKRMVALSNAFLMITFPIFLLPFRKAFYYWTKAVNTILKNPNQPEMLHRAFKLAKMVNPDMLYTDNNKALFFSFLAALCLDLGSREEATEYINKSSALPHKKQLDALLEKLNTALSEG